MSSKQNYNFLILSLSAILLAKVAWSVALFFLPKNGVDIVKVNDVTLYDSYKFGSLFKTIDKKDEKIEQKEIVTDSTVVNTIPDFKLQALYIGKDVQMIGIKDGNLVEFLKIGDSYKDYILKDIKRNEALFDKNGAKYLLKYDENSTSPYSIIEGSANKSQTNQVVFTNDEKLYNIPKNELLKYTKNFSNIWKEISINEKKVNGLLVGFEVKSVKKDSVFEQIGLKSGDLIKKVNDKELKSEADAFFFYKNIEKMKVLKLTVLRDGKEKEIEYEVY